MQPLCAFIAFTYLILAGTVHRSQANEIACSDPSPGKKLARIEEIPGRISHMIDEPPIGIAHIWVVFFDRIGFFISAHLFDCS